MELDEAATSLWCDVVAAVRRAVAEYPADVAELTVRPDSQRIVIHARRENAADIEIGFNGVDEVYLGVGLTDAWIWQTESTPLAESVYRIVEAVMAGRIEEAGSFDASARVQTPDGELRLGSQLLLPVPWKWRRRRTYAAYS